MNLPFFSGNSRPRSDRRRSYRPSIECLDDRNLLSGGFGLVNLASDVPGLAPVTDPNLVNPWGLASSPTGPFWFAENARGVSDILDGRGTPFSLVAAIPSSAASGSAPSGTAFNGGDGFAIAENGISAPSRFLYVSENGTISGWSMVVDPTRALLVVDNSGLGADYTGLALGADATGQSFLYAADFGRGTIDVFDQNFKPILRSGSFLDPSLPQDFAPFNVQNLGGLLFVTYARHDASGYAYAAGSGNGFIDVYDTSGALVRRFASQGPLDAPWGLALAPADFGPFGGALLVGNNGDGHINAYDPVSGARLGEVSDANGNPLTILDLWALKFGNGHVGGDANTLFFTAGLDDETHGLFGALQAPDRRGMDTAGSGAFDPNAPGEAADYPLPPKNGPALRGGGTDRPSLVADLMPLSESPLILVPTLSTIPSPVSDSELVALAGPTSIPSANGAIAVPPSYTLVASANENTQTTAHISLDTPLHATASPNVRQNETRLVEATARNIDDGREFLFADRDAAAPSVEPESEGSAATAQGQPEKGQSPGKEQGLRPGSVDGASVDSDSNESRRQGHWKTMAMLSVLGSMPMVWISRTRFRRQDPTRF